MALSKPKALPAPERIVVTATFKANLGNFESVEVGTEETYNVGAGVPLDEFRARIAHALREQILQVGSGLVDGLNIRSQGSSPAGEVALLFKHLSDESKL